MKLYPCIANCTADFGCHGDRMKYCVNDFSYGWSTRCITPLTNINVYVRRLKNGSFYDVHVCINPIFIEPSLFSFNHCK